MLERAGAVVFTPRERDVQTYEVIVDNDVDNRSVYRERNSRSSVWQTAPGAGFGKAGKEESGTWERLRRSEDQWYIRYGGSEGGPEFSLRLGLTSFKHVGVFPEQAPNWEYIYRSTRDLSARLGRWMPLFSTRLRGKAASCMCPRARWPGSTAYAGWSRTR